MIVDLRNGVITFISAFDYSNAFHSDTSIQRNDWSPAIAINHIAIRSKLDCRLWDGGEASERLRTSKLQSGSYAPPAEAIDALASALSPTTRVLRRISEYALQTSRATLSQENSAVIHSRPRNPISSRGIARI